MIRLRVSVLYFAITQHPAYMLTKPRSWRIRDTNSWHEFVIIACTGTTGLWIPVVPVHANDFGRYPAMGSGRYRPTNAAVNNFRLINQLCEMVPI